MDYSTDFWRSKVFGYVMTAVVMFMILTTAAMFAFPAGTGIDHTAQRYSFFGQQFSALGVLHTRSGASNLISASLFMMAMALAGLALIFFSRAFLQFFQNSGAARISAICASTFGAITGFCFIGVGFTPPDLLLNAHAQFTRWGFRFFTASALLWAIALFHHRTYPKRYAWIFIGFGVLLLGFVFLPNIMLKIVGYSPERRALRQIIMSTGQMIIVYAALVSVAIQSYGARSVNRTSAKNIFVIPANEKRKALY